LRFFQAFGAGAGAGDGDGDVDGAGAGEVELAVTVKVANTRQRPPGANGRDDEEQKPSFEILEFGGFFHVVWNRPNEDKMSDGGRPARNRCAVALRAWERASLAS